MQKAKVNVLIGKVVGVHGIKGKIKILPFVDDINNFFKINTNIKLQTHAGDSKPYLIIDIQPLKKKIILLKLKNIDDINIAESLIGWNVIAKRSDFPDLCDSTYYWTDLIGIKVYNTNNDFLGCVDSIISTGANDVYVVKQKNKTDSPELRNDMKNLHEVLIPAIESVVKKVDIANQLMVVTLPEE